MTINDVARYFDINSELRPKRAQAKGANGKKVHWLPQWLVLLAGIWIEPSFSAFRTTGAWHFENLWGWTLFSIITAFLIFPAVYRKAFDEDQPLMVLLPPLFTAGLGWHSLLGTIVKAAAASSGMGG